jgi:CHAT domain
MVRQTDNISTNVLFLSANPKGTSPLELIKECNNIRDKIKSAEYGRQFRFEQRHEVSLARLDEFLLDYKPQIVHFSGHGDDDGILMFQDIEFGGNGDDDSSSRGSSSAATRNLQSINGSSRAEGSEIKDVADLFRILNERDSKDDEKIRCVVLNACYSQKQARAISKYVDCVVGMKNAIRDDVARIFAETFYHSLCSGQSVYTAFELAKNKVARLNLPGQDIPKLLPRKDKDPKRIMFIVSDRTADPGKSTESAIGPIVKGRQKIKKAKNKATTVDAEEISKGTIDADQQIDEAESDATTVKVGRIG